jgi:hypothetical protein
MESSQPTYPHLQLLHQLQSTARQPLHTNEAEEKSPDTTTATNSHQRRQQQQQWDLSTDALLATFLHEFSNHMVRRTHHVSREIQSLQSSVNKVGVDVAVVQGEWMRCGEKCFMEQIVGEDVADDEKESGGDGGGDAVGNGGEGPKPDEKESNNNKGEGVNDDDSADIARLEAEEQAAIQNGMKALSLFFDPRRPKRSSTAESGDNGDHHESEADINRASDLDIEEDVICDNCYYYPSADEDKFNQRPLPFIIGSREFMESSCAGLGGAGGG